MELIQHPKTGEYVVIDYNDIKERKRLVTLWKPSGPKLAETLPLQDAIAALEKANQELFALLKQ
jgi:hypothetical protein